MSTQNESSEVKSLIKAYGEALSTGNAKAIGGFYTADGAILPNGRKTVERKQLDRVSGDFLNRNNFKIDFHTQNITITGDHAIVEAEATTSSSPSDNQHVSKTTRDLFVLRKQENVWKIYRYIFNNAS